MATQLSPRLEAKIAQILESGHYTDAEHVMNEALHHLEEHTMRMAELQSALAIGIDQLDRGAGIAWTPAMRASIMQRAKAAVKAGKQPKPDVCP